MTGPLPSGPGSRHPAAPWDEAERLAILRRYAILDTPPEQEFDDLCEIAAEVCHAPVALVNLVDSERQFFKAERGLGLRETPLGVSICVHAILQNDLFVVPDTLLDPRFSDNPLVRGAPHLRFYAGAVLVSPEGLPLGTLCVLDHAPRPDGLTPAQERTLQALARQAMTLLEHRRLMAALAQREAELERVQKIAGVGGLEVDLRGGFRNRRSPQYLRIHGLSPEAAEETHQDWVRRIHPDDRLAVERHFVESVRGDATEYRAEYRIVRPSDGAVRWIHALAEIERDAAGRPLRLVGAHRDVTERRLAEEALRDSERRLRAILDTMPQMVWSTRPDGFHDYYNQRWYDFTGVVAGSTDGEGWNGMFHPEDRDRAWAAWRHALASGEPYEIEYRLRDRFGDYRWVLGRALPIRDADGAIERWFGTCTDIHDQKTAEDALRVTDERLQLALNAAGTIGLWLWDVAQDRVFADARFARLFAVEAGAVHGPGLPLEMFLRRIHPEDRPRVDAAIEAAIGDGEPYEVEYRVVQPDGTVRWVNARGRCERDAQGRPTRFPGTVVDITERKCAEAELAARTAQLETLLTTAPVAVWFTDDLSVGRVMRNDQAAELMGLPKASIVSLGSGGGAALSHLSMHWNGAVAAPENLPLQRAIRGETVRDEEYELHFLDGDRPPVTLLSSASPLRGQDGAIFGAVAVSLDITARKQIEEARELLARELSHRIKNIFSVVSGLVALSARNHPVAAPFAEALRERLHALAQAHEYVRPHSPESAPDTADQTVHGLLKLILAPYLGSSGARVRIAGADAPIGTRSATALALVLHEQATNAVKYGALSLDSGRVDIEAAIEQGRYRLTWRESGGPTVAGTPERKGFGTVLAARSVAGQLGGELSHDWRPEGLVMSLSVPEANLLR